MLPSMADSLHRLDGVSVRFFEHRRVADRRSNLRFEIVGRLRGTLAVEEAVRVHNVSPGGALVEVSWSPSLDAHYTVHLESDRHLANVEARVCHVRPSALSGSRYLVGLEFLVAATDAAPGEIERVLQAPGGSQGV